MHIIAAKAVPWARRRDRGFGLPKQILKNAKALAGRLLENGFSLVSGGTDNHLMMLDLQKTDTSGRELQERLDSVRITANKNKVPADPRSASETSGLRLGTPASTSRGFTEGDMVEVADLITLAFRDVEKNRAEIHRPRGMRFARDIPSTPTDFIIPINPEHR